MTLYRARVTIASRLLLPLFPVFAAGVGLSFAFTPRDRLLATPTLRYIDEVVGLDFAAIGFSTVALLVVVALIAHHRELGVAALCVFSLWMVGYAAAALASAADGSASWSAWTWPAFIAATALATALSLAADEQ